MNPFIPETQEQAEAMSTPVEEFEPEWVEAPDALEQLKPVFAAAEDYLKAYWHDPRFGIRYAIGLLQLLQIPDMTIEKAAEIQLQDVQPLESL